MKKIKGIVFYKINETVNILEEDYNFRINPSNLRYKIEVLECYLIIESVMYILEKFLPKLTIKLSDIRKNKEKFKNEIKVRINEIEKELNLEQKPKNL